MNLVNVPLRYGEGEMDSRLFERNLSLVEAIAKGLTYREAAEAINRTPVRVRQIVLVYMDKFRERAPKDDTWPAGLAAISTHRMRVHRAWVLRAAARFRREVAEGSRHADQA